MYIPSSFVEPDQGTLHNFIEQYSFAVLVTNDGKEPVASHLPLLLDRGAEPHGRLIGHMARANPQWQSAEGQGQNHDQSRQANVIRALVDAGSEDQRKIAELMSKNLEK